MSVYIEKKKSSSSNKSDILLILIAIILTIISALLIIKNSLIMHIFKEKIMITVYLNQVKHKIIS